MKRLLSAVTAVSLLICLSQFCAFSSEENKEYPDIVLDYSTIFSAVTDGVPTVIAEKTEYMGEKCVRIAPNVSSSLYKEVNASKSVSLDSWGLQKYKIDLYKYKYAKIRYFYKSDYPVDSVPIIHLLPQKVLKTRVDVKGDSPIASGKISEATFCLGDNSDMIISANDPHISQIHFFPFGDLHVNGLCESDELYIFSFTFSTEDPDPARHFTVTVDGKNTFVKPGGEFILPKAIALDGKEFMGYIPASNTGELIPEGTKITVNGSLTYTSYYLPKESISARDIVYGDFAAYYNTIVDGNDTGFAEKSGAFLLAYPNAESKNAGQYLKLDGWNYGSMQISSLEHKYAYILMRVENASGITPVMNVMKSDVFSSPTYITSDTTLTSGKWTFAEFDLSSLSEKLLNPDISYYIKQIHFLPFGNRSVSSLPENARVYIDKIICSKTPLNLVLHDKLVSGYGDGGFMPEGKITRAEAATLVSRLVGTVAESKSSHTFSDVSEGDWYYPAVSSLRNLGIIGEDSHFRPDDNATRAELADMVYGTGLKNADVHISFPDLYEGHRYYDSVRKAAGAGIINGYTDGTFRPDAEVTRAEAVRIILNAEGRAEHNDFLGGLTVFSDVDESHWCFRDISELSVRHILNGERVIISDIASAVPQYSGGVSETILEKGNAKKEETDELFLKRREEILYSVPNVTVSGKKYYVSNDGSDDNSGLSPDAPFKTVEKVNKTKLSPGDGVFFRRGDVWREALVCSKGVTYSSYGEETDGVLLPKPRFYGSPENGGSPEKWSLLEGTDNIWKFHIKMRDVGGIVAYGGERVFEKVVCHFRNGVFYVDSSTEEFSVKKHLTENLTFFSDVPFGDLKGEKAFGYVYLRCDEGNPGELYRDLEFITTGYSIYFPSADCVIDNLCAMYSHGGINGSSLVINATIQNCEVGYVGGNLQGYDVFGGTSGKPTRYGNGINFYGACNGFYVRNNYVHDVYDAGISNQYQKGGKNEIRNDNIEYSGNLIERCCYGIEYFMGVADSYVVRIMTNLCISDNIIRDSGYGFGRRDPSASAAIKGWDHNNHSENFVIRDNVFCNSYAYIYHIGAGYGEWLPTLRGNTYIQGAGTLFGRFGKNPTKLYEYDYKIPETASFATGEPDGEYWFFKKEGVDG